MKKKGNFVTDSLVNWVYILGVFLLILFIYLIISGKLSSYVGALNDMLSGRK